MGAEALAAEYKRLFALEAQFAESLSGLFVAGAHVSEEPSERLAYAEMAQAKAEVLEEMLKVQQAYLKAKVA